MDAVLLAYVNATNDSERGECLNELVLLHVAPVVRRTLRFKLGLHVSDQGTNRDNPESEDVYQEAITKVVQTLRDLKASSRLTEIENLRHYVASIAANVCIDFLRSKSPAKYRLKHNVRDIFNRHRDFRAWKVGNETVGGFAAWRDTEKLSASDRQIREMESNLETFRVARFGNEDIRQLPITRLVAEALQWIDRPISIDHLTMIVSRLLGLENQPSEVVSLESFGNEFSFGKNDITAESTLAAKELLARLWQMVQRLPAQQRDCYCLSFEDADGADLFSLLLEKGIASIPEIAQALGRSVTDINRLRSEMPLDYMNIAAELGSTRSLVTQWRFRAIQRLRKELGVESPRK
ncbi:MAG TPA: sigma-70 family RNA polymerase sigma factor [Pyrinomonadaceae bacterium]|jgi:RNA polymerase sigma factor (sigma-70 family)|nr:sigma-70 family RNA polymerase sigma factor [Pyrinomonadaceae bacterium]